MCCISLLRPPDGLLGYLEIFLREFSDNTFGSPCRTRRSEVAVLLRRQGGELRIYHLYRYLTSGSEALFHHSYTVDAGKTASSASVVQINIAQSVVGHCRCRRTRRNPAVGGGDAIVHRLSRPTLDNVHR